MKKIYVILFCLTILLAPVFLCACGEDGTESATPEEQPGRVVKPDSGAAKEQRRMPESDMTMPQNTGIPGHERPETAVPQPPEIEGQNPQDQPPATREENSENDQVTPQLFDDRPVPGVLPLDENDILQVSDTDRCPVCAMQVAKHPKSAAAIVLADGTTWYFCGTGCMLKSWMHPEIYLGVQSGDLEKPVVQEYFTGAPVDAREVKWVAGSDVIGPMGPSLVPVDMAQLAAFQARHGGATVFSLADLDDARWKQITGKDIVSAKMSE